MEKCKHNAEIQELHDDSPALFQVTDCVDSFPNIFLKISPGKQVS